MRLLVLNYEYPPLGGGSSTVTSSLCHQLTLEGAEVDLITMAFRGLPRVEKSGNLTVYRVPGLRSRRHISYIHELLTYVISATPKALSLTRSRKYDLVHSHFIVPSGVVAYRLQRSANLPYVITAHGSDVPMYNPDRFRRIHRWIAPLWQRVVANASSITSPSAILGTQINKAAVESIPIKVLPNAIDPDWNRPAKKQRKLLVVSRLFPRKGVQCLLQALADNPTGLEVHIVGDGPHRTVLQEMSSRVSDRVVFHGWLTNDSEELKRLFAESLLFVFPSEAENFPMCLLEAMVSGCAIVASDIPGCREVLGDTAVYVAPHDSEALGAAVIEIAESGSQAEDLGLRARQRAVEYFSWQAVGKRYYQHFEWVLGRLV